MSVRTGDLVAITPSGISYAEMRPEDVCLVDHGRHRAGAGNQETPSSETPMHLAIYAATKAGAVVHTHSPEVIALSAARGRSCRPSTTRSPAWAGRSGSRPTCGSGRRAWPRRPSTALDGRSAVILRNHGAVTYGRDLAQAYDRALLLEWLARTYRLALSYGEPSILSAAELDEVTAESRRRRYGERRSGPAMSEPQRRDAAWPLGTVTVLGAHILDVLGRPVETIPPGQGSVRLQEIRATAAGTAAGTAVDLAKLGARVLAVGALGDDLLGDIVIAAMARHGVDTAGLIRKSGAQTSATILPIRPNGERPAFHVPGATRLFTRADVDLERMPGQPGPAHRRPGRARRDDRRGAGAGRRGGQEQRRARRRRRAAPRPPARTSNGSPRCWP